MKIQTINLLGKIVRLSRIKLREPIYIEGGLGSQILASITFLLRSNFLKNAKVKVDTTYFSKQKKDLIDGWQNKNGLSIWKYQLDYFNISFKFFNKFEISSINRVFIHRKDNDLISKLNLEEFQRNRNLILQTFPIGSTKNLENSLPGFATKDYAVIHIRRGDYLNVSQEILTLDAYLDLVNELKDKLPDQVVFISDSQFEDNFKNHVMQLLPNKNIYFKFDTLDDPCEVHSFMRKASLLVCSNSTYSYSAALLNFGNQLILVPKSIASRIDKYCTEYGTRGEFLLFYI